MKAVNLIPPQPSAARGGRTGGAAYALLGLLALLVVMASAHTITARSIDTKQAEVARISAEAASTEAAAGDLKSYVAFAALRESRVATVRDLAKSRFDWAYALNEVARTIPGSAWLTSLRATVNPASSAEGSSDPLRAALPVPAIELSGCATTHSNVARTMSALRRIAGVQRVSVSSSTKAENAGGPESSGGGEGCGRGAQFSMTVFFEAQATQQSQAGAAQTTTAPATGGTTP